MPEESLVKKGKVAYYDAEYNSCNDFFVGEVVFDMDLGVIVKIEKIDGHFLHVRSPAGKALILIAPSKVRKIYWPGVQKALA